MTNKGPANISSLENVSFLTVTEVANMLRVSRMSVYRMINAGDLEAARFGRSVRIPTSAVAQLLNSAFDSAG